MEIYFLVLLALILVVLFGTVLILSKGIGYMKEALLLFRAKFDADFLRRFDTVYNHLTKDNKFEVVLDAKGNPRKVMKDDRY